ncbi:MAG: IPT/TIG domain-containing protein [Magnetococcales bacterium]|nr:IPT/TIG domain-containing protein [Magnetococcales bacterium]
MEEIIRGGVFMPWNFEATFTGVTYNFVAGSIVCTGTQWGTFQYGVSAIDASPDGGTTYPRNSLITGWTGVSAGATFAPPLAQGNWAIRLTTSDNTPLVLLNAISIPRIASIVPATGVAGTNAVINGLYFGSTQGAGSVRIGGVLATVVSWGDIGINIIIPATLLPGTYDVVVTTRTGAYDTLAGGIMVITSPSKSQIAIGLGVGIGM